jgi:hypothetical protein
VNNTLKFFAIFVCVAGSALIFQNCGNSGKAPSGSSLVNKLEEPLTQEIPVEAGETSIQAIANLTVVCHRAGTNYSVTMSWTIPNGSTQNVYRRRLAGQNWNMANYQSLPMNQFSYTETRVNVGETWEYNVKFTTQNVSAYMQVPINATNCQ